MIRPTPSRRSSRYCLVRNRGRARWPRRASRPHPAPPTRLTVIMKLKLDLHDIYNRGQDIDRALNAIIDEAVAKKAPLVEIIPGKGSGQLKKHVLKFLDQKEIKAKYHRVEKDSKNFGRVFIHFRWRIESSSADGRFGTPLSLTHASACAGPPAAPKV